MTTLSPKATMLAGLGGILEEKGHLFQKKSINPPVTRILSREELEAELSEFDYTAKDVYCADRRYALTDWTYWKEIFKYDLTDKQKYITDFFDCDNYIDYISAKAAKVYGLNSLGKASVNLYDPETGKFIAPHRCGIVPATEGDQIVLYFYEAQNDETCVVRKTEPEQIKNWCYVFARAEFN